MTSAGAERIFHIATKADWLEATKTGTYTTSTAGRTLAEEGFIHASRRDQVQGVFSRYYATAREPLVLLAIDPSRLHADLRVEAVGGDTYPHIYGPVNRGAVVGVSPLDRRGGTEPHVLLMAREMAIRLALAVLAMLMAYAGAALGEVISDSDLAPLAGAVIGLAFGLALMFVVLRRRA